MRTFLFYKNVPAVFCTGTDQPFSFSVEKQGFGEALRLRRQGLLDERTKKWFPFEIKSFINPLLEKRQELQKSLKKEKNTEIQKELNSKQNSVKLMINTLYGPLPGVAFASPFAFDRTFKIGNTIIADNITGRARANVWKLAKSFNCNQIITDGSTYSLTQVFYLKDKKRKPGLNTFSNLELLEKHRSIEKRSLGDIDWKEYFESYKEKKDKIDLNLRPVGLLAKKHIDSFWEAYGLKFAYQIEHKEEHLAIKTAYFAKGHYALNVFDMPPIGVETGQFTKKVKKIRGHQEYCDGLKDPYHTFLENILDGLDEIPEDLSYINKQFLSIPRWRISFKKDPDFPIRPGEMISSVQRVKLGNTFMPFNYVEAFQYSDRKLNKKEAILFEKFHKQGLKETHKQMLIENKENNRKKETLRLKKEKKNLF